MQCVQHEHSILDLGLLQEHASGQQWAITSMNMLLYQDHMHVIDNDYYKLNIRTTY